MKGGSNPMQSTYYTLGSDGGCDMAKGFYVTVDV